jgi:hypothetical protein
MARKAIPEATQRAVLAEAGYRCGVPTCRGILALDLHHLEPIREDGSNDAGNLIALCPTCHALHERGTIPREAIESYKSILVALTAAFDRQAVDQLMFLAQNRPERPLLVSGDGVVRFASLIGAGYADYSLIANNKNQIVTYSVDLSDRGVALVRAWESGRRADLEAALEMRAVSRETLVAFLKQKRSEAAPLADWIAGGLSGSDYQAARGAVEEWAGPVFQKLMQYDRGAALTFNNDGGERFPSTRAMEALERRLLQLEVVIRELEAGA